MADERNWVDALEGSGTHHVLRGDYEATARDLIARLGYGALTCALDCEVHARKMADHKTIAFWGRVRSGVIRLRLAEGAAIRHRSSRVRSSSAMSPTDPDHCAAAACASRLPADLARN